MNRFSTHTATLTTAAILLLGVAAAPSIHAQTKPDSEGFERPSVSVRPSDRNRLRTTATSLLGWRVGLRTDSLGQLTFLDAAAKADAAGLASVEGVSTQKVSTEIQKPLDYNLTAEEIVTVKDKLDALRLRMPAYYVHELPADELARRRVFEFARDLGADIVIAPADPASFAQLDKVANQVGVRFAAVNQNPSGSASALATLSDKIGISVNLAGWQKAGIQPVDGLAQIKDRVLAADLGDAQNVSPFLVELSRLQPPTLQADWPPPSDGGAKKSPGKPLFLSLEPAGGDLAQVANTYETAVVPAIAWRIETLSRMQTISTPENLPPDVKQKIDAAIPRHAVVAPKKPRKLLVLDLCADGGYYHATIPDGNLALELIGKYTGAYVPTFSNDLNNLKYPKIKEYDAVFLNSVEGELFIDPEVMHGLMRFVREGGGVAGLHATTFASTDVPEFGNLIGAQTGAHKYNGESGTLRVEDPHSPITKQFEGKDFDFYDEYYHFLPDGPYSREKLHILLSLDPNKTELSANRYTTRPDKDYGVVWISKYGEGRVFNCALGHRPDFYESPKMQQMILAAIQFVLGDLEADTTPSAQLGGKK
jgi:type 1 glutamine amidotransferase